MIEHRRFSALGRADYGWLKAHYHFALSKKGNPAHIALGPIIVWNDDEIVAGAGFPSHGHTDMEIITYVREGTLIHRDNFGNAGGIKAGEVQVMSAGTGIKHAESSADDRSTKLFQIWIEPRAPGGQPHWSTKPFPRLDRSGTFVVLASGFDDDDAVPIRANARVVGATIRGGISVTYELAAGHVAYLVASTGIIRLNGRLLEARDGAAIRDESLLRFDAIKDAEIVLVDAASSATANSLK